MTETEWLWKVVFTWRAFGVGAGWNFADPPYASVFLLLGFFRAAIVRQPKGARWGPNA